MVASERIRLRRVLLDLAARRGCGVTFCPSEAARVLGGDWRGRMEAVRAAASILAAEGRLTCTQGGHPVDPLLARGPIRLGKPAAGFTAPRKAPRALPRSSR